MSSANPPPPPTPDWTKQPPPPIMPPPPTTQAAGWYADPWHQATWRWWDGHQWTAHVSAGHVVGGETRKPRLPAFLSVPVILGALPGIPLIVIAAVLVPLAVILGLVPALIVGPVLLWMDRVEPEPWSERLHAFLWGAFVAGAVSLVVNTIVATASSETVAAVVSAPIIEEITKGLAIVWAVRRREVDGIMDGLVYAGFSALGFAIVEDFSYFFVADGEDLLFETFVGRALLTPFAHPLFTAWTGLAIGMAVKRRASLATAWWGLALAIASHAAWNGSLTAAESEGGMIVTAVAVLAFVALFLATVVGVIVLRRRDKRRYAELYPWIAQRYGLAPDRMAALTDPHQRRIARRQLDRGQRRAFDEEAAAVARLAALYDHPGTPDPADEARLVSQLHAARSDAT